MNTVMGHERFPDVGRHRIQKGSTPLWSATEGRLCLLHRRSSLLPKDVVFAKIVKLYGLSCRVKIGKGRKVQITNLTYAKY